MKIKKTDVIALKQIVMMLDRCTNNNTDQRLKYVYFKDSDLKKYLGANALNILVNGIKGSE